MDILEHFLGEVRKLFANKRPVFVIHEVYPELDIVLFGLKDIKRFYGENVTLFKLTARKGEEQGN